MVPEFVVRTGGSKWNRALPAIRKEACGFEDFEAFNLWASTAVARTGGSKWPSALPTGSKCVQAQPARRF